MKENIHPNYHETEFECACGNKFTCGTTKEGDVVKIDICSKCHPFYNGKHDIGGAKGSRAEAFMKKYGIEYIDFVDR